MKHKPTVLSRAVANALSAGAAALIGIGISGAAVAQAPTPTKSSQAQPKTLQAIIVTGSHIRRVDLETDNPITNITAQQIQQTGKLTLGDVLQRLPQVSGGNTTPTVNNGNGGGGSGETLVGLRGLGASRTLVLIDGQRVISKDLNAIPAIAIQKIEVLTSGAAAIYGSDAIGGVINIILKSNFHGAQFQANYGISDHNDGERKGASFMFGESSDKGNIFAGVSYNKFDPILQSARKFSANALSVGPDGHGGLRTFIGGSVYTNRDYIVLGSELAPKFGCADGTTLALKRSTTAAASPTTASNYKCFTADDRFNYAGPNFLLTPQERVNAFFKGSFHLSDNVDFYGTFLHNDTNSAFQFAPGVFGTPTFKGLLISKDSYYNPFGVNFSQTSGTQFRSRLTPLGDRISDQKHTTDEAMIGLKGSVIVAGMNWSWDAGYDYGHISNRDTLHGKTEQSLLAQGLGPSFLNSAGTVQCGTPGQPIPLSECVPWDPFNLDAPSSQAVLRAHTLSVLQDAWQVERTYHADANGGIFNLPAGTAQLAVGILYRKDYQNNIIDPLLTIDPSDNVCPVAFQCSAHLQGGFSVKEAYTELFVPVLQDLPFAHGLNFTLGDRYSKYSDVGSTNNWKVGVEYRPVEDLLLRGTVSTVFRAPTVADVFGAPSSSAPLLTSDPCDHIRSANPACVGVPLDGSFVDEQVANSVQINALNSGSKFAGFPISPEKGKSFDFGVVYSPHFVPGLTLTADAWRIYLNDTITLVGVQTVLDSCFNGITAFCPMIHRIPAGPSAGQVANIVQPTANLGRIDVKGTDVSVAYDLPATQLGQVRIQVSGTYLDQFKIQTNPGAASNAVINGAGKMGGNGSELAGACPFAVSAVCFFPRIRGEGDVSWSKGPWSAAWTVRYSSGFSMYNQSGLNVEGVDRYGAWVYNDATVGYLIEPINTRVNVGVDNLMDKKPPQLFANRSLNSNTDPQDFDTIGRYYWARVTVEF